jgi:hypothetical protein
LTVASEPDTFGAAANTNDGCTIQIDDENDTMIHAKDGSEVLENLTAVNSPGTGIEHWGSSYFGPRYSTAEVSSGPQALMTQMSANETILPHFHGVAQFQIFPSGAGVMGKTEVRPLMLQYKDHHSAYGPLVAGPHGLTFIALRNRIGDSAPVYLSKPGYREKLKPSKRRNWISPHIPLSTRPIMQHRKEVSWEPVFDAQKTIVDEMSAQLLRLGAGMSALGPDPRVGGGYYVFVANGTLQANSASLPAWSMVYVEPTEGAFEIKAGHTGLEALVMQFPKDDD